MLLRPTWVRVKIVRFHNSAPGYTQNAPRFTLPNKDTPKSRPVLGANLRRGSFRGVCNTPLYVYMQKLTGFIFPNRDTPKNAPDFRPKSLALDISGRMQYASTRVRAKPVRFHIPASGYAKNAPDFTFSNKDTPITRSILDPNLRRGFFRGVCFCALHGYVQNLAGFGLKPSSRLFEGRMQYAPTRIHEKFGGFHISASGCAKNPPGFIPKSLMRDILGAYAIRPYTDTSKIWRVSFFRTQIRQKRTSFHPPQ